MRDFLNGILAFISAASLNDMEFDMVEAEFTLYDQATYDDLAKILIERAEVSTTKDRLIAYYNARGVDVVPKESGSSNIYLGSAL